MKPSTPPTKPIPLKMVGGSSFGRYPKISPEVTYNMLITDGWMVNFPGYEVQYVPESSPPEPVLSGSEGRAIYSSEKAGVIFAVIDNTLYSIDATLNAQRLGQLQTSSGDVFIAENNASQIEICDGTYLYNYNYATGIFSQVPFPTTLAAYAGITFTTASSQVVSAVAGTTFTVGANNIIVTALGAYQNAAANIFQGGNVQVGIFDNAGALVVSTTIFSTINPPNSISYVPIAPTTLIAGQSYTILQTLLANALLLTTGTIVAGSAITITATRSAAATGLTYTTLNTYGYANAYGPTFQYATSLNTLRPLYVEFQDTYFIVTASDGQWYLSYNNNGLIFPIDSQHIGEFQTKPDLPIAAKRIPGIGNKLLIFGTNVTEPWADLGLQLFPNQRDTFNNIDYGCLNAASIAALEDYVVWLGGNEQSGPTIMYTDGQSIKRLSTDGIGFALSNLSQPSNCYGFLFRQYDHVIYVLVFPADNYSLCYDFTSGMFSNLCAPDMTAFIAMRITYFNNKYYFVSIIDGNLYQIDSNITTYNGDEIPCIRIPPTFRLPDASRFIGSNANFVIEQGAQTDPNATQVVDLSVSKDGGNTYGPAYRKQLNPQAKRRNRLNFWNLDKANELTCQFRFHSFGRTVFTDGELNVYQ